MSEKTLLYVIGGVKINGSWYEVVIDQAQEA